MGSRRRFLGNGLLLAGGAFVTPGRRPAARSNFDKERPDSRLPSYVALHRSGELAVRAAALRAEYENCSLCPRDCRVDRTRGQTGRCRASSRLRVASAFPHSGEERPLSGSRGSGTIFFSHCGLRCVYCQNHDISIEGRGRDVSPARVAESMLKLQEMGCHNINLVTPTHFLPGIIAALEIAVPAGLRIPLVYNTSGFEKPEILRRLDGIVDIYLPDFKYWVPEAAARYSSDAFSYPHYARLALREMHRQVGVLERDGRGVARRGLIIRHLVLPNRLAGTREVLKFIAEEISRSTAVNIMRQYRPEHRADEFPKIDRRLTSAEYRRALEWADEFGLTNRV